MTHASLLPPLFEALDRHHVRYCVLHSWEGLPDQLESDLDMAVHPEDTAKIPLVIEELRERGFTPVQILEYDVGASYYVFESGVAIDFISQHRQGGLILMPGDRLVAGRRRHNEFWIPPAETEFAYLLAKKTLKGGMSSRQAARLQQLVAEIGRERAESVAAVWFGEKWKQQVVELCVMGAASGVLKELRRQLWRTTLLRDPLNPVRCFLTDLPRRLRRWLHPSGVFVAVLGPDGAGKSTLVRDLPPRLGRAFRRSKVYHWRPALLGRRGMDATTAPHSKPPHTAFSSIARLLFYVADYQLGYWLCVRPALARSGLILFDRYYADILADPQRYRYGGPLWLVRALRRLVPAPDVMLVLDASEADIRSRKREVELTELRRQIGAYRLIGGCLIGAGQSAEGVADDAKREIARYLAERLVVQALPPAHLRLPPGLLVPTTSSRIAAKSLDIYAPYAPRARAFKALLTPLLRSGWRGWPADRVAIPPDPELRELIRGVTGECNPILAMSFGTPGRFRKLTVQVMTPSAEILGYLKIPLTPDAAARVRREAAALNRLSQFPELTPYVPRLLEAREWRGGYLLFQSSLEGKPGPRDFSPLHSRFLDALGSAGAHDRTGSSVAAEAESLWREAAPALDPAWRDLAPEALDFAWSRLESASVPCGFSHGDFAPWNTRVRDGCLLVFDWESAETSAPLCWDIFHFETQRASLLRRPMNTTAMNGSPQRAAAFALYLLHSACHAEYRAGVEFRRRALVSLLAGENTLRPVSNVQSIA